MNPILLALLYAIGSHVPIQLVGTLTLTDLIIAIIFIFYLLKGTVRRTISNDTDISFIFKCYAGLLGMQLLAELLVGNTPENIMKGTAVTVLSFMKFIFLWNIIRKNPKFILYFFTSVCIAAFIFEKPEEEVNVNDVLSGEQFSYFKFKVAPLIGQGLVILTLIRRKAKDAYLFMFAGLFCIVLGARSTGLMIFLTGVFGYFIYNRIRIKKITCVFLGLIGYGLFVLYVSLVLSGDIISGNSSTQLKALDNPYNPIYALLSGRQESPASLSAIYDKPLIGHGAWTPDPDWKYHKIAALFQGEVFDNRKEVVNIIPGHSVILQSGVNNGIFAMFLMVIILFTFIRKGGKSLVSWNKYSFLVIFCIMQLLWNGFFSPMSHFRGAFPLYFVCCLYSYKYVKYNLYQKNNINNEKKNISSYSNFG